MYYKRIAQINVNHFVGTQELLKQTILELNLGLIVICEPYANMTHEDWEEDRHDTVAVYRNGYITSPSLRMLAGRQGYIITTWGNTIVIGVYAPPRWTIEKFENTLQEIDVQLRNMGDSAQLIIAGDFNAKSPMWGTHRMDERGRILMEWTAEHNVCLINNERVSTCCRWGGESVVHLIWATPDIIQRTKNCEVMLEMETLSDHRLIVTDYIGTETGCPNGSRRKRKKQQRNRYDTHPQLCRWAIRKINEDYMLAAIQVLLWINENNSHHTSSVENLV